jgi:hypothetical protein
MGGHVGRLEPVWGWYHDDHSCPKRKIALVVNMLHFALKMARVFSTFLGHLGAYGGMRALYVVSACSWGVVLSVG